MHAAGTITNLSPVLTLSVYTGIALHTSRGPVTESATYTTLYYFSVEQSIIKPYLFGAENNWGSRVLSKNSGIPFG